MSIIPQIIINSIIAGSIYSLVALGFNLIYGTTKFFNLAHGVIAAIGGYTVFYFTKNLKWNLFFSIFIGILIAGLIGWLLNKFIYLPLRKRKASNMILLIASIGTFTTIQAIIAILFTSQFQTLSQNTSTQKIFEISCPIIIQNICHEISAVITQIQIIILISTILITTGLMLLLYKTKFGKAVRAINDDEEVAKIVGINTNKIIGYLFFIGSAIAGLSGILIGFDTGIEPTMGMDLLLKGIIASIIGGIGNIYGSVLGAFLLGFIENFSVWKISGEWKNAIAFSLLILFLIFRPKGIINR